MTARALATKLTAVAAAGAAIATALAQPTGALAIGATPPRGPFGAAAVALPEAGATTSADSLPGSTQATAEPISPTAGAPAPAPTGTPTAPASPRPPATQSSDRRLSNERTFTTWAHPVEELPIYASPSTRARRLARIHMYTEDGFPEVYLLLSSHIAADGTAWVKLRVPERPNGHTGWVLREALGTFHVTHWQLVVDRRLRLLTAYYGGRRRFVAPVGVGKPSSPTPPGRFWIRERFRLTSRSSPYWPYALGTSDYSTLTDWPGGGVVGIHGDFGAPQLIPGDPSHGCVRMHDSDLAWLAPRLTLGTPVRIL
jgi:lipoprotein-anchoring transpeptidase ErfK/SrfK